MNNLVGEVTKISNVTEDILQDCYMIANQTRPRNAEIIYGMLARDVNVRKHILFIYVANNIIYGFLKGHILQQNYTINGKIDWLFVDKCRHNQGVGTALMNAYVDYCVKCGCKDISVEPVPSPQAWAFYGKHGFKRRGQGCSHIKDLSR